MPRGIFRAIDVGLGPAAGAPIDPDLGTCGLIEVGVGSNETDATDDANGAIDPVDLIEAATLLVVILQAGLIGHLGLIGFAILQAGKGGLEVAIGQAGTDVEDGLAIGQAGTDVEDGLAIGQAGREVVEGFIIGQAGNDVVDGLIIGQATIVLLLLGAVVLVGTTEVELDAVTVHPTILDELDVLVTAEFEAVNDELDAVTEHPTILDVLGAVELEAAIDELDKLGAKELEAAIDELDAAELEIEELVIVNDEVGLTELLIAAELEIEFDEI